MTKTSQKKRPKRKRESFFLPDGTCTHSPVEYISAWRQLARDVGSLVGMVAYSWDPDLAMVPAKGPLSTPIIVPLVIARKMQSMKQRISDLERQIIVTNTQV